MMFSFSFVWTIGGLASGYMFHNPMDTIGRRHRFPTLTPVNSLFINVTIRFLCSVSVREVSTPGGRHRHRSLRYWPHPQSRPFNSLFINLTLDFVILQLWERTVPLAEDTGIAPCRIIVPKNNGREMRPQTGLQMGVIVSKAAQRRNRQSHRLLRKTTCRL